MAKKLKEEKQLSKIQKDQAIMTPPSWVPEVEDVGTAMMQAGQEFLLVVDDVLLRYFKFSEESLKDFHEKIKPILQGVKEYEKHGLSMLSQRSVDIVGDIIEEKGIEGLLADMAKVRLLKEKMNRSGLEYPTLPGAGTFVRQLKKKNKNG